MPGESTLDHEGWHPRLPGGGAYSFVGQILSSEYFEDGSTGDAENTSSPVTLEKLLQHIYQLFRDKELWFLARCQELLKHCTSFLANVLCRCFRRNYSGVSPTPSILSSTKIFDQKKQCVPAVRCDPMGRTNFTATFNQDVGINHCYALGSISRQYDSPATRSFLNTAPEKITPTWRPSFLAVSISTQRNTELVKKSK